jgi:conjugal transfer/entry exclusion protein
LLLGGTYAVYNYTGIDPELKNKLKQTASWQEKSINQLVLEIIRKELGLTHGEKLSKEYNDIDDLFGRWSEEEYSAVSRKSMQNGYKLFSRDKQFNYIQGILCLWE